MDPAPPLLRLPLAGRELGTALALTAAVGAGAAWLVASGNPGNMGICGACFLRDTAGALGLHAGKGPGVFRPEVAGLLVGAFGWMLLRGRFQARSGSHAATRFLTGVAMGVGALVFLGCPFRMFQRLGGGDLNALVGAAGLVAGVGGALALEKRGYSVGKTAPAPAAVGLLGPLLGVALLAMFLAGGVLSGPGAAGGEGPPRAPWALALAVGLGAGAALSATGFCGIAAARQVWGGPRPMLLGALALVSAYGAVAAATGKAKFGFEGQPAAHADHLWNFLSLALVGAAGAFGGGCPVRQIVMAGEGNGDALVTVFGIALGGSLAHNLGLVSTGAGATPGGRTAVVAGLVLVFAYGAAVTFLGKRAPAAA